MSHIELCENPTKIKYDVSRIQQLSLQRIPDLSIVMVSQQIIRLIAGRM